MYCPNPECEDRLRTGEPGEYREGIANCPRCDAALTSEWPEQEKTATTENDRELEREEALVPCCAVENATLVPQVKAILRSAGIPCYLARARYLLTHGIEE